MSKKLLLANAVTALIGAQMQKTANTFRPKLKPAAEAMVRKIVAQQTELEMIADETDESSDRSKLKVLNDGDGVRLLMSIYQDYVSDDDYVKFPQFMYDVDTLLYKARGNRTLTREEREEMEESAPKRGRRPKKRKKPEGGGGDGNNGEGTPKPAGDKPTDGATVTASDDMGPVGSFFTNFLNNKRAA